MSIELGLGMLGAALALGIRHGIDWDHIAAITDITSTTTTAADPHEGWLTREPGIMLTDESHHSLATATQHAGAIAAAESTVAPTRLVTAAADSMRPGLAFVAQAMEAGSAHGQRGQSIGSVLRFLLEHRRPLSLGALYALGHGTVVTILGLLAILASEFLPSWVDPLMERVVGVTLLFLAGYLFYSLYRFFRGGGEFRIRSRWMLIFAGARNGLHWLRARVRGEHQHLQFVAAQQYGARTAYGVGMIHGIGAETGTQVLVIATAVGAGSTAVSIAILLAFVMGLLISNSAVSIITTAGFVSAQRRQQIYVGAGLVAAFFSLVIGLVFLFGVGVALPDLGRYFRWIGGPD